MKFTVHTRTIYNCTLERAFKTAILCDVSKIHTGKGVMPAVTHCTEDEDWGEIGSIKKVHVARSLTQKGGFGSTDKILERVENEKWVIEVANFQSWILGFNKFIGIWETTEIEKERIQIDYTYELHAKYFLLYPLNWLFARLFWKGYMKQVLRNIEQMIANKEPYTHQ